MPDPDLISLFARSEELHVWAAEHIRTIPLGDETITIAPPEYVILRKLEYFREGGSPKHLRDIRAILSHSSEIIDQAELARWIKRRELEGQWKLVQT